MVTPVDGGKMGLLLFLLAIATVGVSRASAQSSLHLPGVSMGAAQMLASIPTAIDDNMRATNLSQSCRSVVRRFIRQLTLREPSSLQLLDASGKPGPGILDGHVHWMGSYDECLAITDNQSAITIDERQEPVTTSTQYCVLSMDIPEGFGTIDPALKLGELRPTLNLDLCLPTGCSGSELLQLINSSVSELGAAPRSVLCIQSDRASVWEDSAVIVSVVVLSIIGLLIITGTMIDVATIYRKRRIGSEKFTGNGEVLGNGVPSEMELQPRYVRRSAEGPESRPPSNGHAGVFTVYQPQNGYLKTDFQGDTTKSGVTAEPDPHPEQARPEALMLRIIRAFSLRTNIERLLSTRQGAGSLGCLNGIRVLSMAWVILGHDFTVSLGLLNVANLKDTGAVMHDFWAQGIINGTLSVDSFFLLSGLLVTYLFCGDHDKSGGRMTLKKIVLFYFHRIWRLTPFYMLILMIYTSFFRHLRNGPLWPEKFPDADVCRDQWWQNILYINNFYKTTTCMGVTWYLANDMQFYVLSPLVLIPLVKRPAIGWCILVTLLFCHVISTAVLVINAGGTMLTTHEYNTTVYTRPYCRVGVYAIGMGLGYLLHRHRTVRLGKLTCAVGWLLALTTMVTLTFVTYTERRTGGEAWSMAATAAFEAVFRVGWGLAVAWVIFACSSGHGGVVDVFLSWRAWVPLSRLTYAAYLLHGIVIIAHEFSRRQLFYYNFYNMVWLFVGSFFLSYAVAFVFSLLLEAPLLAVEKAIRRTRS